MEEFYLLNECYIKNLIKLIYNKFCEIGGRDIIENKLGQVNVKESKSKSDIINVINIGR